ncbi:MAG TPA: trypsin-like peptidase domain-containing protein [Gemmataceae bacterium]|nr:trypsin-like peptidase domain-containing protein [Gemmataceae bacterium]
MNRFAKALFFGSCAFAGGAAGTFLLNTTDPLQAQTNRPAPPPAAPSHLSPALLGERFEAVIRQMAPSVVSVEAVKPPVPGKLKPTEESGSGVIVRLDGVPGTVVITNNHVVNGAKADQITVHLADDKIYRPTKVWADPESDVAALKIEAEGLYPAPLADSDRCREGNWVLAFGSPFGLNRTVTHGIISARDRGQVSLGSTIRIKDFLQTDAAINPGSSGGPLVNLDGEIVGINTAIASHSGSNSGVAFAIPINLVKRVVRQLAEKGAVSRGYLGVHLAQTLEPTDALKLGLDKAQGALVEAIYPDTPAAAAGLRANDVILQVDGVAIRNENHLINHIAALPIGQRVKLQVWRDRRSELVDAVVGDWNQAQTKLKVEK